MFTSLMRRFVRGGPSGSGAAGDGRSRVSPGFERGTKSWGGNGIIVSSAIVFLMISVTDVRPVGAATQLAGFSLSTAIG